MDIPIRTLHLFPVLDAKLIGLLQSLKEGDWQKPTLAKLWTVKDIVAHLLDGNLRTTSLIRDGYFGDRAEGINSYEDLVAYLNRLNHDWVKAMRRLSPRILIGLLETSGKEYHQYLSQLDPFKPSLFPVSWAGEDVSQNWFHIAREYTEKWHHQQQIREAVGQIDEISSRELFHPVLQTFLRALPHTYRNTTSANGSVVQVAVIGNAGGTWEIKRGADRWDFAEKSERITTKVEIDQDYAWKLFTKALKAEEITDKIVVSGDESLAQPLLSMIAIMG